MKRILLFILTLLLLATVPYLLHERYRAFTGDAFVRVEKGTSTVDIGRSLAQIGVVRYAWKFWLERAMKPSAKLQAGEYRFRDPASVGQVFDRIARGDVYF